MDAENKKTLVISKDLLEYEIIKNLIVDHEKLIVIEANEQRYKVIKDRSSNSKIGKLGHIAFLQKEIYEDNS